MATSTNNGHVRLWDAHTAACVWNSDLGESAYGVEFSPDSLRLLAHTDRKLAVWDVQTAEVVSSRDVEQGERITSTDWCGPDAVAFVEGRKKLWVWKIGDTRTRTLYHSTDGELIATCDRRGVSAVVSEREPPAAGSRLVGRKLTAIEVRSANVIARLEVEGVMMGMSGYTRTGDSYVVVGMRGEAVATYEWSVPDFTFVASRPGLGECGRIASEYVSGNGLRRVSFVPPSTAAVIAENPGAVAPSQ